MKRRAMTTSRAMLVTVTVLWGAASVAAQDELPPSEDVVADDHSRSREDTYETSRGLGMGTGARASAVGTSAVAYNPANLAMARVYHMESFASYVPDEGAWTLGGAVADSVSNKIAAGISFRGVYGRGNRNYRGYDSRLALAMPLSEAISIGVTGRYIRLRSRLRNEGGARVGESVKALTLDAAIRLTATEGLHIAALGYNLIKTGSSLAPMRLGGSISYSYQAVFSLGVDVFVDLTSFDDPEMILGGGAEYLAGGSVPIRLGYRRDAGRDLNQITASVGYIDQAMGIDIGLRQDIASDTNETSLVVAFRYHVQ